MRTQRGRGSTRQSAPEASATTDAPRGRAGDVGTPGGASGTAAHDTPRQGPHARATVLVVDDEEDVRESLRDLLERDLPQARVVLAASGRAALEVLAREPVSLILTDYRMPGMNGLEFLAQARARVATPVPRILTTAYPDLEVALRAVNEECVEQVLVKPMEPANVVGVVAGILDAQRSHDLREEAFRRSLDLLRQQLRLRAR